MFIWVGLYNKIQNDTQTEIKDAMKEAATLARIFGEHTGNNIHSIDNTLLYGKRRYEQGTDSFHFSQYIQEISTTNQAPILMSITDATGDVIVSSQNSLTGSRPVDREQFEQHQTADTGQLLIGKPVPGRSAGKWILHLTRRINNHDGSFAGVIVAAVDLTFFSHLYQQADLGDHSTIDMVGQDGSVLVRHSPNSPGSGRDISHTGLAMRSVASPVGSYIAQSPHDGITRIYSYHSLTDYPLVMAVGIAESVVLKSFHTRVQGYLLIAALATTFILLFTGLLLFVLASQKRVESDLTETRNDLELRVTRRTQQLYLTNQELFTANEKLAQTNLELKKAQSQIIHQEKMISIGQLAAGVAHEINNPLSFVVSNLDHLTDYLDKITQFVALQEKTLAVLAKLVPERNKEISAHSLTALAAQKKSLQIDFILQDIQCLLQDTLEGTSRVKGIVQNLRGFAKVGQDWEPTDINACIESTLNVVRREIATKALLTANLGDVPLVRCNPGQMNQVFLNILLNASQAIATQGEIRISTWAEGNQAIISISDTGCGIPPEVMNRIFDPFFTTKEVGQGSGLGLSVVYDIVKNHGGIISVTSAPYKETTFKIILPIDGMPLQ